MPTRLYCLDNTIRTLSVTRLRSSSPYWLPLALGLLALVGCGRDQQSAKPAAQAIPAAVITVAATDVPYEAEFVGETESSQEVEIRARVEGFLESIEYREGSIVNKGDVLFQMDSKPFVAALDAAKSELQAQQARLATASANLKRVGPLAAEDALSQKDLDDAQGSRDAAVAAVEGAKSRVQQAEINLSYTTIRSPLHGATSFARKQPGSFIAPGPDSLLTYVSALDPMRVNFSISENEQLRFTKLMNEKKVRRPEDGKYTVKVVLADGTVVPAPGRVTFGDASFNKETGTFLVRAEIPNKDGTLRPGQFVRVLLGGATWNGAIELPQRAVMQGPQGNFVWVVDAESKAQFRPVTGGPLTGERWLISEGIKAGERVVVDGGMKLAPGVTVKPLEPGEATAPPASASPSPAPAKG
ncbi:MAG: efflux RND transporter periplasmic adaptor subunit [Gammaproteobacteria bacterium]|nr:efflux RND transporter periplasmic adaptor subunit [Gammaproteobacteria bacterium]